MLKVLFIFMSLTSPLWAAPACKVFGISDSPQGLRCRFSSSVVKLSCIKGKYFLNRAPVSVAFHYEVEEGTVPLVFKAGDRKLIVMMDEPITAEYQVSKEVRIGACSKDI